MYGNARTPFTSDVPVGRAGVVSIPMNQGGIFTDRYFGYCGAQEHQQLQVQLLVYSSSLPMEWPEFSAVLEEINGVCSSAYPQWQRVLPCGMTACGFVMFAIGGFLMVSMSGFNGPSPLAMLVVFTGFVLFGAGGFGAVCGLSKGSAALVSKLRFKLSELNARYAQKGIDWQLHESQHLEMYHRTSFNHHGGGTGVRTVKHYTLVVQALGSSGQREIPLPELLVAQALQMASAPPMQANMEA